MDALLKRRRLERERADSRAGHVPSGTPPSRAQPWQEQLTIIERLHKSMGGRDKRPKEGG